MMTPEELYLDYVNNFLTVQAFADHYGMTKQEAESLIEQQRKLGETESDE